MRFITLILRIPGHARKLLEAPYLADLAMRPGSQSWTVRADIGSGVQLYSVDQNGHTEALVQSSSTAQVGTWEGVIAGLGEPQRVGVLSYQWAPNGTALWYSKLRLNSPDERSAVTEGGLVYDDRTMHAATFKNYMGLLNGVELHLFDPSSGADRLFPLHHRPVPRTWPSFGVIGVRQSGISIPGVSGSFAQTLVRMGNGQRLCGTHAWARDKLAE